ncbi:MAG TPA: TolC family protein [Polyangiaceae bacterium]|nr:TolC family protein [Polyangiaceae bacterium]
MPSVVKPGWLLGRLGRRAAIVAWALLFSPHAGAVDAPPAAAIEGLALPSMGLEEALRYARERHPAVLAARARLAALRAEAEVPGAQWAPSVGAFAEVVASTTNNSTTTVVNNPRVDLPRIGATPLRSGGDWAPSPSTLVAVGVRQQLYDFGRIAAQTAAADAAAGVEALRGQAARLDVDFAVAEAYYAVLAARAVLRAAASAEARSKTQRDFAKAGVERGLRPPLERTRAEADVARFEVGRVRAEGGLAVAQSVFAAAVGVPAPLLDARDEPPAPEAAPPPLASALRLAMSRDPAILEARARVTWQRAQAKAIGALLRPDLFLTGSLSGRAGGADPSSGEAARYGGWVPHIPNWSAALVLSLPLYDANVLARRDAARVAEGARAAEARVLEQRQSAAVRQAYTAVEVARAALSALERSVEAARANQEQADARFKAGLGTALEVADAEALRTDAEIQLAVGAFQLGRSRAALARATAAGGP